MVDGVIIAEDADRAERRSKDQRDDRALWNGKALVVAGEHDTGDEKRYKIAKKAPLHRGQIPGKPNARIHAGKAERGRDDEHNALIF